MNEFEKLKRLLDHWQEHNDEHAETYKDWAEKAASFGNKELSGILESLHKQTKELSALFEKARKKIG
ncbi:MAG TPA: hypothetical protein VEI96_06150 [Thermodesulfovibrionales bacterium]|nr:hypothetical protein [Thermodesulfovibrionales bacterium]